MTDKITPSFELEHLFPGAVVGIDEAGCGPWAGPVVAGAAIFTNYQLPQDLKEIHDSKKLTHLKRERLYEVLEAYQGNGVVFAHGLATVEEIDEMNIGQATRLAMQRAVEALPIKPTMALVDGIRKPQLACPLQTVIKGDQRSYSIAAASIVAKVVRDRLMTTLSDSYPEYGWAQNAGYGTAGHIAALQKYGITPHHRQSFKPIAELMTFSKSA